MGLLGVVRSGIKIANTLTVDLQTAVTLERYVSDDGYGTSVYAAAVPLKAIEDWKQKPVKTAAGQTTLCQVTLTFLDVAALLAATGNAGLDWKDKLTTQDGRSWPILTLGGFMDPGTSVPVATEVSLG